MRHIENRGSLMRAVAVALASGGAVNVGQPAPFGFRGNPPRGAGRGRHNVGNGCSTGTGVGLGYPPSCGPGAGPMPGIPVGADGCPEGFLQCKQDLPITSLAVAAGANATITVTPRRVALPYQLYYHGAANSFVFISMRIDGVEWLGTDAGGVNADRYNATVTDHSISLAQFSSTTPLIVVVNNITAGALDFRATLSVVASRG